MREILFRGQQKGDRKWVEGSLVVWTDGDCEILTADWVLYELSKIDVHPETVGQFTGLTDKNGKRVFEGDILARHAYSGTFYYKVCWNETDGQWVGRAANIVSLGGILFDTTEVAGNIHDNPELLEANHV